MLHCLNLWQLVAAARQYLHVSLFEQRLVSVGGWVGDDDAVVFTLGPETLV